MVQYLARKPRMLALDPPCAVPSPWMKQTKRRFRQHAINVNEVFGERQRRESRREIAGPITADPMAENQVLSTCRRANRIDLHKAERLDRRREIDRLKQRPRDCVGT